ncbi:MAG: hypothetical protein EZS28_024042 [Streblomastix strix]|uniref:Uncharacterized protein n=1 Tax=Streblomastix strix TaxID=222440 RepID=A0A5J4VDC1_9EUKA|nr:MAG: hypothetical protein EZS28_024042 [Streblomastix strix]
MEKYCIKESLGQDKATSQFHRVSELSKTTNQEGRTISTQIEQDQTKNSEQQRLECISVPKFEHNGRDKLMGSKNRGKLTNKRFELDSISHSDNSCVIAQIGGNTQISESGRRDLVPRGQVQEVESIWQQPMRDSGSAVASLCKLTDRILKIVEDLNIQIHSFHIKWKTNIIPDSLSRLATSGDYFLKEEILHEALMMLRIKPTADMFTNRRNKKFRRFASLVQDNQATAHNNQQSDLRKDNCSIGRTILASTTVVTKHIQNNEEIRDSRRKRRRNKDRQKETKTEEATSIGQDVDCSDRGKRVESLFRLDLQQRGLDNEAVQGVTDYWHSVRMRYRVRLGQFKEF